MFELVPMTQVLSRTALESVAFSALPGAPVVPERAPRAARLRVVLSSGLHRLGDGVAPRRAPECVPAH